MEDDPDRLRAAVENGLWPVVEELVARRDDVAGVAVAVVRDGQVAARGFGVRDLRTGEPVTPETVFHLASVSKPFVATGVVALAVAPPDGVPALDLDAPVVTWVPELTLADGREHEVTARGLLSHSSGLPDVSDYGWHDPQLDDDALSRFVRGQSHWRLASDPGSTFSYSNAGYELLGLLLSRVVGTTFEDAVKRLVLAPAGMRRSTFLRADVPAGLAATPHVGLPLTVPGDAYPYTRRHAPSSTLHSNLVELARWVVANVGPDDALDDALDGAERPRLPAPGLLDLMGRPVVDIGEPPWDEAQGLGWAIGAVRGRRTLSHSGADPGFGSRLVLVPQERTGVVVLANSNTVPTSMIATAALEVVLDGPGEDLAALRALPLTPGPGPDLDDERFENAVWGAIELHRTDLVRPLLALWTSVRPESSQAWTMSGWADQVDGDPASARRLLEKALALDPENADAALILGNLAPS